MADVQNGKYADVEVIVSNDKVKGTPRRYADHVATLLSVAGLTELSPATVILQEKVKGDPRRKGVSKVRPAEKASNKVRICAQPGDNDTCYFCDLILPSGMDKRDVSRKLEEVLKTANEVIAGTWKNDEEPAGDPEELPCMKAPGAKLVASPLADFSKPNKSSQYAQAGFTVIEFMGTHQKQSGLPTRLTDAVAEHFYDAGLPGNYLAELIGSGGSNEFEFSAPQPETCTIQVAYSGRLFRIGYFLDEAATMAAMTLLDPAKGSIEAMFDYIAHEDAVPNVVNDPATLVCCLQLAVESLALPFAVGTKIPSSSSFLGAMARQLGHPMYDQYPRDRQVKIEQSLAIKLLRHRLFPDGYVEYANGTDPKEGYVLLAITPMPLGKEIVFKSVKKITKSQQQAVEQKCVPVDQLDLPVSEPTDAAAEIMLPMPVQPAPESVGLDEVPQIPDVPVTPPITEAPIDVIAEDWAEAADAMEAAKAATTPPEPIAEESVEEPVAELSPEETVAQTLPDVFAEIDRLIAFEKSGREAEQSRVSFRRRVERAPEEADAKRADAGKLQRQIEELERRIAQLEREADELDREAIEKAVALSDFDRAIQLGSLANRELEAINTKLQQRLR